ncbi:MAG: hypothetical protein NTY19_35705 [Planctomycetota bacterium]|nr:hypothetical protein [Planctomycetota bacterium]
MADLAGNLLAAPYQFEFVQQLPDLVVTGSVYPLECVPGQQLEVQWTVSNVGRGIAAGLWTDVVSLSANAQGSGATELEQLPFSQPLGPGESYTRIATVTVPANDHGSRWIVIAADGLNQLDEVGDANNVSVRTPPLLVTTRAYPDLRVTDVTAPSTLSAGETAVISWTVVNDGTGATTAGAWSDAIYLSSDQSFDAADIQLAEVRNPDFLGSHESYRQTKEVAIPDSTPRGTYYLLVVTDRKNQVQEFDRENNNTAPSNQTCEVITPSSAFLTVTDVRVGGSLEPGVPPTFTWTVTNTGGTTISYGWSDGNGWDDALALSRDPVYQEKEDYWLGSHTYWHGLPLRPEQSYTSTGTAENGVPAWEPGIYYLIVIPDQHWGAGSGSNQSTIGRDYGVAQVRLEYVVPDLVPASVTVPPAAIAGQPLRVDWRVENRGAGQARTSSWSDEVYLSLDGTLDSQDWRLGSLSHSGSLNAGAGYLAGTKFTVPGSLSAGTYHVIIKTDAGGNVPESDETNNVFVSSTTVEVKHVVSDLQVVSAEGPATGVAGDTMTVDWTVINDGADTTATDHWSDAIYFSTQATFDPANASLLKEFAHSGALDSRTTYSRSELVALPERTEGTFHLFLVLDVNQDVFELGGEDNNVRPLGAAIEIADNAPDLAVQTFTAPINAVADESIQLAWSVQNVGSKVAAPPWQDAVYLSSDATLEITKDQLLGSLPHNSPLGLNDSYGPAVGQSSWMLPDEIEGQYFLFYVADSTKLLYEKDRLANNVARQVVNIVDRAPDLQVAMVSTPALGVAGELIAIDYRVVNHGTEAVGGHWKDAVYLSADTQFDPAVDRLFGQFDATGPLAVDADYGPQAATPVFARLPDRIEGTYYILLVADSRNAIYEKDAEANNVLLSPQPIEIILEAPDLKVTTVESPLGAQAGTTINIGWTVTNDSGQATAETVWQDGVYLSRDTDFIPASDIELGVVGHSGALRPGESYSRLEPFSIRQDLEGPYYVYTVADVRHQVFEHAAEDNNTTVAAQPLTVQGVRTDLQITSLQASPNGVAGGSIRVAWQVTNAGADGTPASSWFDTVYLSDDTVLDPGDTMLATFPHNAAVAAGGFYWQNRSVALPVNLTGPRFLIFQTDSHLGGDVYEYQGEDNNTATAAIELALAPPADLQVTAVQSAATAWSGQEVQVQWTVTNQGGAVAQSWACDWYDSVYLSRDAYLDTNTDLALGSFPHEGSLAADGGSYTQSVSARLPRGISGPYYVFVLTDSSNRVAERGGEGNNAQAAADLLEVSLTPPSDLQVTQITPPASGFLGEPVSWQFRVDNIDTDAAYGAWYDTLYLSADQQWDLDDPRIGRVQHQGDVPHAGYYEQTVVANVPGVAPGDYYVIVRTDILNDVREKDETNNTTVSADQVRIEGRDLVFDQTRSGQIADQQAVYFRVQANPGDDVVVTLVGDAASGVEMYLSYEAVPARNAYGVKSSLIGGTQQLRVPVAEAGSYYLLVYRDQPGLPKDYQLTARRLDFSVSGVTPAHGGNVGNVTVLIRGGQLPEQPLARLVSPQGDLVYASRTYPGDGASFYATFDLTGRQTGAYDVEVGNAAGAWAVDPDAFAVEAGTGANLQATLNMPTLVRPRAPFAITVEYVNTGDVDMVAPLLRVKGPAGLPLGFTPSNLDQLGEVLFLAPSATGPAGILRPGDRQTITLYSTATTAVTAHYTLTSQTVDPLYTTQDLIDWKAMAEEYRPPFATNDEQWESVWRIYTQQIGATWDEVITTLGEYVTEVGQGNVASLVAGDLMQAQFRMAMSRGGGLTDNEPPWIMTHTPGQTALGGVDCVDLDFSEDINPASFTANDVVVTDPLGRAVTPIDITPISSRTYRIEFPAQTLAGKYEVLVGPEIEDLVGQKLDQDRDGIGGETADDRYHASFALGGAAPTRAVQAVLSSASTSASPWDFPFFVTGHSPHGEVSAETGVERVTVTFSKPCLFYSFMSSDVTLTGPNGATIFGLVVHSISATQYEITFLRQNELGVYTITVGPNILDLDFQPMDGNLNGVPGELDDAYAATFQIVDRRGPRIVGQTPIDWGDSPVSHVRLTFNEPIDAASFTVADVSIQGPAGAIAPTLVALSPTVFDITFANQTGVGSYAILVGPHIQDLSGNEMDQNADGVNGTSADEYSGEFGILPDTLVVYGTISYGGDSAKGDPAQFQQFGNDAQVTVELWEQKGDLVDDNPGEPGPKDTAADELVSKTNERTHTSLTTDDGKFLFLYDIKGLLIANLNSDGIPRQLYLVVYAANDDAFVVEEGRLYHPKTAVPTRDPSERRVDMSKTVTDKEFNISAAIQHTARVVKNLGMTPHSRIEVLYPDDYCNPKYNPNNACFGNARNDDVIHVGTDMAIYPGVIAHEYGHALEYVANGYKTFPHDGGNYGTIEESNYDTTAFAEGWASFIAALVFPEPTVKKHQIDGDRQFQPNNHFWMGVDGKLDGVNDNGNTGDYVLGAVQTILWHLATRGDGDGLSDLHGVWTALRATAVGQGTLADFYEHYPHSSAADAIFIDQGVPVIDDKYETSFFGLFNNDTEGGASNLGPIKELWSEGGLIMAEKGQGNADWFKFNLPKAENADASNRKSYELNVTIEFNKERDYGDLDLWVSKVDAKGIRIGMPEYRVDRSSNSATVTFNRLWNNEDNYFYVCVAGYGVLDPKTGEVQAMGGDYNPNYRLIIDGKVPPPEKKEDPKDGKDQSTGGSHDPNDKLGPLGFGTDRYLAEDALLPYTVRFENDPTATAAAVLISIQDQLDANFDWSTFELGNVQFGDSVITVPAGLTAYQTRVDLRPLGNNLLVDLDARLDKAKGLVQWTLTGIDPATGELSQDATAGFLPPNDPATHSGEGFVSYTLRPKAGLFSGTQIANMATIVFDWNDPMDTPWVTNIIDSLPPISSVQPLPTESKNTQFQVSWSGADDAQGAGIHAFDVYVSDNGDATTRWLQDTTSFSATYAGLPGHTYRFYCVALDNVGHREAVPTTADAETTVDGTPPSVTINQAAGQADPASTAPVHFTVVFSEPVTGFTAADVLLSGTVLGALAATVTAVDMTTYDVAVSGLAGNGTVTAAVVAGAAVDVAGNLSQASTSQDDTVLFWGNPWQNYPVVYDAAGDDVVTALDVLVIIHCINTYGPGSLPRAAAVPGEPRFYACGRTGTCQRRVQSPCRPTGPVELCIARDAGWMRTAVG